MVDLHGVGPGPCRHPHELGCLVCVSLEHISPKRFAHRRSKRTLPSPSAGVASVYEIGWLCFSISLSLSHSDSSRVYLLLLRLLLRLQSELLGNPKPFCCFFFFRFASYMDPSGSDRFDLLEAYRQYCGNPFTPF